MTLAPQTKTVWGATSFATFQLKPNSSNSNNPQNRTTKAHVGSQLSNPHTPAAISHGAGFSFPTPNTKPKGSNGLNDKTHSSNTVVAFGIRKGAKGFSILETLIAIMVFGMMISVIFSGILFNHYQAISFRNGTVATSILRTKMETVRLCIIDQLTNLPATFVEGDFSGTLTVEPCPFDSDYSDTLRLVTIRLTWFNNGNPQSLTSSTLWSKFGLNFYEY